MKLINLKYHQLTDWITSEAHHSKVLFIFNKIFYLWMIFMAINLYSLREVLWSTDSLSLGVYLEDGLINNFFLKLTYVKSLGNTVFWIHLISAILSFIGLLGRLPKISVYITGFMLFYGAPSAFNGGFILAVNYAFILIFYSGGRKSSSLNIILDNLVWISLIVQLVFVYLNAALFKWTGHTWLEGQSVWYAAHMEVYFNEGMGNIIDRNVWLALALNYAGLMYQTLFPILIWVKKIKKPFLIMGVIFHLFISLFMNIPFFGTMMMMGYILLWDLKKTDQQLPWFKMIKTKK